MKENADVAAERNKYTRKGERGFLNGLNKPHLKETVP